MPILYGEGFVNAFHRLQVEVFLRLQDYSTFLWTLVPVITLHMYRAEFMTLTTCLSNIQAIWGSWPLEDSEKLEGEHHRFIRT